MTSAQFACLIATIYISHEMPKSVRFVLGGCFGIGGILLDFGVLK